MNMNISINHAFLLMDKIDMDLGTGEAKEANIVGDFLARIDNAIRLNKKMGDKVISEIPISSTELDYIVHLL